MCLPDDCPRIFKLNIYSTRGWTPNLDDNETVLDLEQRP